MSSRRGHRTRPGVLDGAFPPLAPNQGCEQETRPAEMTRRRHKTGRHGRSLHSSRSQSGMRAGDDVRRDDGATARGQASSTEVLLLSLPIRDASRRRRPPKLRCDGTRPGPWKVFPLLSPGMRAGDDDGGTTEVHRGRSKRRSTLGRADPEQGPPSIVFHGQS